ncbi:MAG: metallophosphoesterase [Actinomycetota bacterium]|nr:metallophosphoesterase [Actinomycetota bacterium]
MRLYYASDIHGSEKLWRKFINSAAFYDVEVLIMGGDLTGKVMVPLVEQKQGEWVAQVFGKKQKVKGETKAAELERNIRVNGFYPVRCDPDEFKRMQEDESHRDEVFHEVMRAELQRWLDFAAERLAGSSVRCFVMPGNDDDWDIDDVLDGAQPPIESVDGRLTEFDGVQMISSAWANPTPWDSPRELPEPELMERLEKLAAELQPDTPTIFNLHCPPYDSGLDVAPELTDDLRVVREGGEPKLISVGSTSVRTLIERYQPMLALHGHIHESRAATEIGSTVCINPGSAYAQGVLDGTVVDIDKGKVVSYQLVSG